MINKRIFIVKKDRMTLSIIFVTFGLLLILLSELLRYIGLKDVLSINGIKKTFVYIMIFFGLLLSVSKKNKHLDKIIVVLSMFTLITIFSTVFGVKPDIQLWRQMIHLFIFLSCFYVFYISLIFLGKEETIRYIKFIYIIVLSIYIFAILTGHSGEGNFVYYLFFFLPITDFFSSPKTRKFLYLFQSFATILSNKRTGLIALVVYFLTYEWLFNKKVSSKKRIYKVFIYLFIVTTLYFLFPVIIAKLNITVFDELNFSHISEDGGSNRLFIYNQLWNVQLKSGIKHWVIGSGYNSVLLSRVCTDGAIGGFVSAHNDFLEVLYDYGIVGLFAYVYFFICLFKEGIFMLKQQYKYAIPFFCSLLLTVIMSMTSHLVIYLNYYSILMIFWAICLSDFKNSLSNHDEESFK